MTLPEEEIPKLPLPEEEIPMLPLPEEEIPKLPLARGGNSETRALGRNINLKCSKMWNVSCHCAGTDIVGS